MALVTGSNQQHTRRRRMIEHPTFMYRKEPEHTQVSLTWWMDGEQYAAQKLVWDYKNEEQMLMAHQYLLEQFVEWVNKR